MDGQQRQPKLEIRVEKWWITTILTHSLCIHGDFYGLPDFKDGEYTMVEIERIDMIRGIAESEEAYIKLGNQMSLDELKKG